MAFHDTKKNNDYHSHNVILTCLGGAFFRTRCIIITDYIFLLL